MFSELDHWDLLFVDIALWLILIGLSSVSFGATLCGKLDVGISVLLYAFYLGFITEFSVFTVITSLGRGGRLAMTWLYTGFALQEAHRAIRYTVTMMLIFVTAWCEITLQQRSLRDIYQM
jgi:hypothetical protein